MKRVARVFLLTMVLTSLMLVWTENHSASQTFPHTSSKHPTVAAKYAEIGISSWYGEDFTGRRMANGAKFNHRKVSFAHRKMPINTMVRVTNLRNGKSIVGTITDRGPYVKGRGGRYVRVLDMSKAAAKKLDLVNKGLAPVKIEICRSAY